MRDKLKNMDAETMCFSTINMNSFSDAPSLQGTLEQPLEKKSGQLSQYSYQQLSLCLSPYVCDALLCVTDLHAKCVAYCTM